VQPASTQPASAYPDFDPALSPLAVALTKQRLAELRRLAKAALDKLAWLESAARNGVDERDRKMLIGKGGAIAEFNRVLRSHCQVTVLELELLGLRKAPDRREPEERKADPPDGEEPETDIERPERSDLADPPETVGRLMADLRAYRKGPLDIVVAEIRKALDVEPPDDDPFAPPPGRRAAKSRTAPKGRETAAPESSVTAEDAAPARAKTAKPAHPRPPFVAPPAKARRVLTRLLSGTARNRGPPH
jgi:hypothetical protein